MSQNGLPHVFLSHSSADAVGARAVAQLLRNAGVPVWLDLDQLKPGEQWSPALETALKHSTHFIVLVGETGVQRWVDREVRYALDRNTLDPAYRVIPLLDPAAQSDALPLFLKQQHYLRLDWRQPDAQAIQTVAAAMLAAPPERISVLPPGESPFRGLLTFDTENSLLFFGRDREVEELLGRLVNTRFLPVVGESGSGKSSLVRAGLIPALLRGRAGMVDWRIATMKPGQDPLGTLAEAVPQFDPALAPANRLALIGEAKAQLHRKKNADALNEILAALQLPANSRQLLVIDQFEQLFTLGQRNNPAAHATRFLEPVLQCAQRANSALQVVVTLRVDFFGLCHPHPELWRLLTEHHYSVGRIERDHLRELIVKPMAMAGVTLDPGLADTMIEEAGSQPGSLALLEHALDQLWRECKGGPPTAGHYNKIGRLKGAIGTHADWVLNNKLATEARREMARRIFLELTALGQGAEDSARRVSKPKLLALPGEGAEEVLQVLTDERLVTAGDTDDPDAVAIAHETLIREWCSLRGWVRERRQDLQLQREVEAGEEAWRKAHKDSDQLPRGVRLEQAIQWKRRNAGKIRPEVDEFVKAARRRRRNAAIVRWGSVAIVIGLLSILALPAITTGFQLARLYMTTTTYVNPKDGLTYVKIRPGEFQMGCSDSDCPSDDTTEEKTHPVKITKGFWIGKTEVTQAAYKKVMKVENPSRFKGDKLPVEQVNWYQAKSYCDAVEMRLPTEAEWEYAARAGNTNERYGELKDIAIFNTTSTARVARKLPNAWGLYDTLGNVWEWTNDWYYRTGAPIDVPFSPGKSEFKVARGGSWGYNPQGIRVSNRNEYEPTLRSSDIGFRCAGEIR